MHAFTNHQIDKNENIKRSKKTQRNQDKKVNKNNEKENVQKMKDKNV